MTSQIPKTKLVSRSQFALATRAMEAEAITAHPLSQVFQLATNSDAKSKSHGAKSSNAPQPSFAKLLIGLFQPIWRHGDLALDRQEGGIEMSHGRVLPERHGCENDL